MIYTAPTLVTIGGEAFAAGSLGCGKSRLKAASLEVRSEAVSDLQSRIERGRMFRILGWVETR